MDLFSRVGSQYALVEVDGKLCGLVTRKDVLRYESTIHEQHIDSSNDVQQAELEEFIWGLMIYVNETTRKFFGKLLFNNELRFM